MTTSALVPVGSHFFTPEALAKASANASALHPGKSNVLSAQLDSNGFKTVLVLGRERPGLSWKAVAAFTHDHDSGNTFAAGGSVGW